MSEPWSEPVTKMAKALAESLRECNVKHMLIGGSSVPVHGKPRFTQDIDLVVSLRVPEILPFMRRLAAHGFSLVEEDFASRLLAPGQVARAFFGEKLTEGRTHTDMMMILPGYEEVAFGRTRCYSIVGCEFSVAAAEDLVLSKLASWRPQDQQDIFSVLSRQRGKLDLEYLRKWAAELGRDLARPELSGRLEEALAHPDSNR